MHVAVISHHGAAHVTSRNQPEWQTGEEVRHLTHLCTDDGRRAEDDDHGLEEVGAGPRDVADILTDGERDSKTWWARATPEVRGVKEAAGTTKADAVVARVAAAPIRISWGVLIYGWRESLEPGIQIKSTAADRRMI